jgi:hypothetical protein
MKNKMFQTTVYQYAINDWEEKKKRLLALLDPTKYQSNESFQSDRKNSNNSYLDEFVNNIQTELEIFRQELNVPELFVTDVWSVKYNTGDFHPPHTHSSIGYSGILYLDYDETEHTGTYFVDTITDPVTDQTNYSLPNVHEGSIVIVPSNVLHFTYPNKSKKTRIIIGFDIKFKL